MVKKTKNGLVLLARNHKKITDDTESDISDKLDLDDEKKKYKSKFHSWIEEIVNEVDRKFVDHGMNESLEDSSGHEINFYASEKLVKPMINLLSKIPFFSNIMNATFGSDNDRASSSCTEAQFRNIKCYVFQKRKGMRLDTWVEKSIAFTRGSFLSLVAEYNSSKDKPKASEKNVKTKPKHSGRNQANDIDQKHFEQQKEPVLYEQWRGWHADDKKAKIRKPAKRTKHSILNVECGGCVAIPILPNGGTSSKSKSRPKIISTQTCAFDSIYEFMIGAYMDSQAIAQKIDGGHSLYAQFLKLSVFDRAKERNIMRARNELLLKYHPENVTEIEGCKHVDCKSHLTEVYRKIQADCSSMTSVTENRVCLSCDETDTKDLPFIPFNLSKFEVQNIMSSLSLYYDDTETCGGCGHKLQLTRSPKDILAFETFGLASSIKLGDIMKNIAVDGQSYIVYAVIEFKKTNEHFVCHLFRNNIWHCYDDLKPNKEYNSTKKGIDAYIIIFIKDHQSVSK